MARSHDAHARVHAQVCVDPCGLPPGLHYGQVAAFDAAHRWRGPLAVLPVVVVVPLQVRAWVVSGGVQRERTPRRHGALDLMPVVVVVVVWWWWFRCRCVRGL